jgi:uncharacterized protein
LQIDAQMRAPVTQHRLNIATTASTRPPPVLLLAHGAGAPMDSPFMEAIAAAVSARGVTVVRFEFDYMALRRVDQKKRPPPNVARLAEAFREAVADVRARFAGAPLLIGGKSMGGRVASMIADPLFADGVVAGCVCLGYPFHPAKQPEKLRTPHLVALTCPTLIVQGDRDALGDRGEVEAMTLSKAITYTWLADGNHDFEPRVASGFTQAEHVWTAADAVARFARSARTGPQA